MTQHLHALALLVRDYDEALAFYCDKLGFRLLEDTDLGGGKRWLRIAPPGDSQTGLLLAKAVGPAQQAAVGQQSGGRVFLFLHTDDFQRDHAAYQQRGVHFIEPPRHEDYGTVAVFEDLYGNRWDLIQPKAAPAPSPVETAGLTHDSPVSLREITNDNLRAVLRLQVTPAQEQFVAGNAVSLAQAHFEAKAWFRAIYAAETPVGFLMLYDDPDQAEYFLWRFMLDARYQKYGYGRQAIQHLIEHVKTRPGAVKLGLSCVPAPGGPGPFYEKLGFRYTGEQDEDELIMELAL